MYSKAGNGRRPRLESLDLRELIVGYSINQSVVPLVSIWLSPAGVV